MGMRSGFKNVANSALGTSEAKQKKSSWVSTAVTIALLVAAVAFFLYRRS